MARGRVSGVRRSNLAPASEARSPERARFPPRVRGGVGRRDRPHAPRETLPRERGASQARGGGVAAPSKPRRRAGGPSERPKRVLAASILLGRPRAGPPSPSPSPTPAPAPVFAPAPRAGLARRLDLTPDAFAFATPSPPRPPAAVPPTFVSAIDRARSIARARRTGSERSIRRTPTVGRKPSETITIVSKARAVDVDVPHAANASAVDPARVARRRHRRRLASSSSNSGNGSRRTRWTLSRRRCTASGEPDERRYARGDASRETAPTAPPWTRTRPRLTRLTRLTRSRARAALVPRSRRSYFGNVARATRVSRPRVSRARRRTTARSSRAHTPGVARRDVARAASTRARARAEGFRRRFVASVAFRAWRFAAERRRVAARLAEALDAARDAAMESRAFAEWRATVARERTREAVALARFRRDAERERTLRALRAWALISDSRRSKRLRRRAARAHRDRVVVSTATRSWAAWVAYASDVRAKGAALASRFSRDASRRAFRAWRFESLGVARLARARDARVTRTVTNRWRTTATVSARARSEAETRFATIRLATLREAAATWRDATRARARESRRTSRGRARVPSLRFFAFLIVGRSRRGGSRGSRGGSVRD